MKSSQAISRHEDFWRRLQPSEIGPYVHPKDADRITPGDRAHMKLDLLPILVNGNLRHADVVIATLNPGFGSGDTGWGTPILRAVRRAGELAALHQGGWSEYPLFDLNPNCLAGAAPNSGSARRQSPRASWPSSAAALSLLQALIDSDEKLVIIPYGVGRWKQAPGHLRPNPVTYPERRRSAYIAPTSPGYQPKVERLLRPPNA